MVNILVLLVFICFSVQYASANEYMSEAFDIENGNKGIVALILNKDTTFESYTRKLYPNSTKVICERKTQSYWELMGDDILLWSLGKARTTSCNQSETCLLLNIGKVQVLLNPVADGNIFPTPDVEICEQ